MQKPRFAKLVNRYTVTDGRNFRLKHFNPGDTADLKLTKTAARDMLRDGVAELRKLQEKLYAQNRWGLLLVFQAMDAAGKGGAIEHVMSGVNPQGVEVCIVRAPVRRRNATTILCGGTSFDCPNAAGSGSSTAHITKRS